MSNIIKHNLFSLSNETTYDYNRELYSYVNRVTKVLNSEYRTLIINQVQEKCKLCDEVPVLYLGLSRLVSFGSFALLN